ncbi:MAG TPA: WYL domain-containing protein [Candidatus Cybelea sp.]
MKANRLVSLLLLLQSRRQCCARLLAQHLEVSERTIYRDVDALCAAGVPVYAERGSTGGIALADGYRRALTNFDEDEVRALFVSGASSLADLGLERGLSRALEKLRGGLADVYRRAADKSRSRIHLDQRRWNQPEPSRTLLTTLRRAVWDDRRLRIRYEDRNKTLSTRTVDPLGLVSKAGVWYLIARRNDDLRSFRVERIRSAAEMAERFERPQDFDLERYWRESSARFNEVSRSADCIVTLRAANDALQRITFYWPAEIVTRGKRESLVRLTFPGNEVALFQALAWSDVATLLEPAELRDAVVARARQALARYANRKR